MKIARLDSRVTIQQLTEGQDEIGQPVQVWANLIPGEDGGVWANIRHLKGMEAIKAGAQTSVVKASICIRARTDVTAAMRVVHGSTVYQITSAPPSDDRRWTFLECEVVS